MKPQRWLQWATADLAGGLGGAEVHARSLARELGKRGIECRLSSLPEDLENDEWDVVVTHGSLGPAGLRGRPGRAERPIRLHTLHGTTFGRMVACREWAWVGGYAAAARETAAAIRSDAVLCVQPGLVLAHGLARLGKATHVCWNGWDSGTGAGAQAEAAEQLPGGGSSGTGRWLFLGRGTDVMKGVDRLRPVLGRRPELRLAAAPGAGFEGWEGVERLGVLDSDQVRRELRRVRGLLVPSRYEGHPLVVLEALGEGTPVIASAVGGVAHLPPELEQSGGLIRVAPARADSADTWLEAIRQAEALPQGSAARGARRDFNRSLLPSWSDVTEVYLKAAAEAREARGWG